MQAIFFYWYKVLQTKVLNAFKIDNKCFSILPLFFLLDTPQMNFKHCIIYRSHALESMSQMDNKIIVLLREET